MNTFYLVSKSCIQYHDLFAGVVLGGAVRGGTKALQRLTAQERLQDLNAASQHLEATAAGLCITVLLWLHLFCAPCRGLSTDRSFTRL